MNSRIPVYIINLERSLDRWEKAQASARQFAIDLRRINAVEGSKLSDDELKQFDDAAFRRNHGKIALPSEIGCYFSHVRALEAIIAAPEPHAVIVEDDVVFTPEFKPLLEALTRLRGWDVVKLVNHRWSGFRTFRRVNEHFAIGRCIHGPLGSAAAYVVTREGAQRLLSAIRVMELPYDVALERGWAGAYEIFTTDRPAVTFSKDMVSTIAHGRSAYARMRLVWYKRLSTLCFRAIDYVRRFAYAMKPGQLREVGD